MANTYAEAADVGSRLLVRNGGQVSATAGGAGDAALLAGEWVDVLGLNATYGIAGERFNSVCIALNVTATLANGETLDLTDVKLQTTTADGSGDPDAAAIADLDTTATTTVTIADATGGALTAAKRSAQVNRTLLHSGVQQFVRVACTPNFSAAGVDTAVISVAMILGGAYIPASTAKV